ncbi:MAG: DUF1194 domain-containing protein [Verrucomicrobiota bacterium]
MKTMNVSIPRFAVALAVSTSIGISSSLAGTSSVLVDLELSLVTDISGSVNGTEYDLQMGGYAEAFRSSVLHSAISGGSNGQIAVNLIFFDDTASVGLGWTVLTGASDANAFADSLDALVRPRSGSTDPAEGIDLAVSEIFGNSIDSTRQVIDVSGDGQANTGRNPADARDDALAAGIDAINGLPIGDSFLEDYFINNIQGGAGSFTLAADNFQDFEAAILDKLEREITGRVGGTSAMAIAATQSASVTAGRTVVRDVGSRLYRMRSGVRNEPVVYTEPAPPVSSKGGMAKGGMAKTPITHTHICRWEVWGQVFYSTEDQDSIFAGGIPGANAVMLRPDTDIDVFGGSVGFEYDFNDTWSAGFAVSGARSDVDMTFVGTVDIDTLALIPYVSYHRDINGMDYYADFLYAYGMNDYDSFRFPGAAGTTDGDFHAFNFNTGLVMHNGQWHHGPYGELRWLDGDIDGYIEIGPGAAVFPDADYESRV